MNNSSERTVTVIQGEYRISRDPSVVFTTVLGSCVAVCLHDPDISTGGMNHFLLPKREGRAGENIRYGAYSMELMINEMLKQGARKDRMIAKLFGGARMSLALSDIGASNGRFAHDFLAEESIPIAAESLGGNAARRVKFWPASGRAKQLLVPGNIEDVAPVVTAPKPKEPSDSITLF